MQKFTLIHFTQQANLEIPLTTAKLTYKTAHYNIKMTYTTLTEKAKITKTKTYNVKQSYQLHTHMHAHTHSDIQLYKVQKANFVRFVPVKKTI